MPQPQRIIPNPLGQVELQPQARPVDTFHAPTVEQPDNTGAQLAQLANALGSLEPRLREFGQTVADKQREASIIRAQADAARYKNLGELRDAVKQGRLSESDNPWYAVQLKREVARNTAQKAVVDMRDEYFKTPALRYSDNPDVVGRFADEKLGALFQGADVWESEALAPVVQNAKADLLNTHVAVRGRERVEEREVSARQDISAIAGQIDATLYDQAHDPNDPNHEAAKAELAAKLPAVRQQLQGKLNDLLNTVNPVTANKWMREAIFDAAAERENADFARDLWGSMTTADGKTVLLNDSDKVALRELDRRVKDVKIRRMDEAEHVHRLQTEQTARHTVATISKAAVTALKNGQPFDYSQAISEQALSGLDPDAQASIVQTVTAMQQARRGLENQGRVQSVEDAVSRDGFAFITGTLPRDQQMSFIQTLMLNGGAGKVGELTSVQDRLANMNWTGSTSPDVLGAVTQSIYSGDLTVKGGGIQQLTKLAEDKRLSQPDFTHLVTLMATREHADEQSSSVLSLAGTYNDRIDSLLEQKWVASGQVSEERDIRSDPNLQNAKVKARFDFNNAMMSLVHDDAFKALSYPEKQAKLSELLDSVARNNGGFTQQGYEQWQAEQARRAQEAAKQQQSAAEKIPVPGADPVQDAARVNGDPVFSQFKPADMAKAAELRDKYQWLTVPGIANSAVREMANIAGIPGIGQAGTIKLDEKRDNGKALQDVGGVQVKGDMPADRAIKLASYRPWYDPEAFVSYLRSAPDTKQITGHPMVDLVNARMYQNSSRGRFGFLVDAFDMPDKSQWSGMSTWLWPTLTKDGLKQVERFETMAFHETQKQAVELNQRLIANGAKDRYSELLRASAKRDLTPAEVDEMGQLDRSLTALAFMRKHAGYTPDEVKQMGGEAWRTHLMFANPMDIALRGAEVSRTLGLKDKQAVQDMYISQRALLDRIRDVRGHY